MKKLLLILILFFAFTITGYCVTELDYMEYANSAAAQAAYIGSGGGVPSPVNQWKMNDNAASPTVVDSIGSDDGTADQNTDQLDTTGRINGALTFNGSSDGIVRTIANFQSGDSAGSISVWFKTESTANMYMFGSGDTATNNWLFGFAVVAGKVYININYGGTNEPFNDSVFTQDTFHDNNWHHAVLTSNGTVYKIYVDGISQDLDVITGSNDGKWFSDIPNRDNIFIGYMTIAVTAQYFDGVLDDIRVYDFTLSDGEVKAIYSSGEGTEEENPPFLQCYSESTIKEQGDYSLKGIATITDSLNETLTRTVTIDLTDLDQIKYDIRGSRTGSQIKIGIHDLGGTTSEHTANIAQANTWQTETWDISGVSNANKDDINSIIITVINADAGNTFYVDNMYAETVAVGITWNGVKIRLWNGVEITIPINTQ